MICADATVTAGVGTRAGCWGSPACGKARSDSNGCPIANATGCFNGSSTRPPRRSCPPGPRPRPASQRAAFPPSRLLSAGNRSRTAPTQSGALLRRSRCLRPAICNLIFPRRLESSSSRTARRRRSASLPHDTDGGRSAPYRRRRGGHAAPATKGAGATLPARPPPRGDDKKHHKYVKMPRRCAIVACHRRPQPA